MGLTIWRGKALLGAGLGLGLALVAARWIQPLAFDESARDPVVYATVCVVLIVVSVAASPVPARRAAAVDPIIALRG